MHLSIAQWSFAAFRANWRRVTLVAIAAAFMSGVGIAFPLVWQQLIDRAVAGTVDRRFVVALVGLIVLQVLPVIHLLRERMLNQFGFKTKLHFFNHILRLSVPFHRDRRSMKIILEGNKGVNAGTQLMRLFMDGDIIADIPVAIFALWFIATHSAGATGFLLGFIVVFLIMSAYLGKRMATIAEQYQELDNDFTTRQQEVVSHIETVRLHRAERSESDWFETQGRHLMQLENKLDNYGGMFQVLNGFAHSLPFVMALVLFLPALANGSMTIGLMMALIMYSTRAVSPAGFLGDMYQSIKTNAAKLKPALRLLEQTPTIRECEHPTDLMPVRHEIRLTDVTLTYPGADDPSLYEVSLAIPAGSKVAIVGKSGSGKSTLARLLVRFYDPDMGIVTMDGTDLRRIRLESLYSRVSYVSQEVPVFSGTVRENVAYGVDCRAEQVKRACQHASATFAFTGSAGLDAQVGELGTKLSGGERQRLALARIFLRQPSVLVLDEATAALDRITEREIQTAFDQLMSLNGGTTMIVIAHRISTVRKASSIVVMDEGRILDQGTHEELLGRCALYQELCQGMAQ